MSISFFREDWGFRKELDLSLLPFVDWFVGSSKEEIKSAGLSGILLLMHVSHGILNPSLVLRQYKYIFKADPTGEQDTPQQCGDLSLAWSICNL